MAMRDYFRGEKGTLCINYCILHFGSLLIKTKYSVCSPELCRVRHRTRDCNVKKEWETWKGLGSKSYMTKGFLIILYMTKFCAFPCISTV